MDLMEVGFTSYDLVKAGFTNEDLKEVAEQAGCTAESSVCGSHNIVIAKH